MHDVLKRHGLTSQWDKFERTYLDEVAMDDKQRRKRLAALPFSEKLKILEKLRERSRVIAAAGLRKTARPQPELAKKERGPKQK